MGTGAGPDLVEVVEGGAVLVQLLLADALGVARQNLVLHLVDGSGDGGQQLLPAHPEVLRGGRRFRRTALRGLRALKLCCRVLTSMV